MHMVTVVPFDFERAETHAPALAGVEAVFLVRPPDLADTRRSFAPFIGAAEASGVGRVVFLSLQGAERIGVVPHRRIERRLARSRLVWTFLRAGFFMQNLSTFHRDEIRDFFAASGRYFYAGDADGMLSTDRLRSLSRRLVEHEPRRVSA